MNKIKLTPQKTVYQRLWEDFKNKYLENFLEFECGITDDKELQNKFRSRANTAFSNFVLKMRSSFVEECKAKGEIWDKKKYPHELKWIKDDPLIQKTLKRYPKLLDVINFIDKEGCLVKSVDNNKKVSLSVRKKDWIERRQILYLIVDKKFYEKAKAKLGIEQITMQKYLQAFCKMGILKQIKNIKLHSRAMVYSDGYQHSSKVGLIKEHWMTKGKHQKALREFSYGN